MVARGEQYNFYWGGGAGFHPGIGYFGQTREVTGVGFQNLHLGIFYDAKGTGNRGTIA